MTESLTQQQIIAQSSLKAAIELERLAIESGKVTSFDIDRVRIQTKNLSIYVNELATSNAKIYGDSTDVPATPAQLKFINSLLDGKSVSQEEFTLWKNELTEGVTKARASQIISDIQTSGPGPVIAGEEYNQTDINEQLDKQGAELKGKSSGDQTGLSAALNQTK